MKITEHNVVKYIQNKNEKAIRFIINQYGGLLTAIIKRYLNDYQQDCEECLDDVLLSIWNNINFFDAEKSSFKQWIAAIAKYKAIDYRRRQITIHSQQTLVADMNDSVFQTKPSDELSDLDELLDQLSASERKIFEKYYLEGVPSREIAEEFNAKPSWVYNKLSRGRKKLRSFLIQHRKYEG